MCVSGLNSDQQENHEFVILFTRMICMGTLQFGHQFCSYCNQIKKHVGG